MPFTIRDTLRNLATRLDRAGLDNPSSLARRLTAHALGRPREWLIAHDDEPLGAATLAELEALAQRALSREPLAYILGHREFHGLDLRIDARVLIPRPETEMLVELAVAELAGSDGTLIDIGTGSGAVAIAVATQAPTARVLATDVSPDALDVARDNAERLGVAGSVTFLRSDLLAEVPDAWLGAARVLTANLPYVAAGEIDALQPEIAAHEPRVALDGGPDGLALVRALLRQLATRNAPGLRAAFLEIGASQGAAALAAAGEILPRAQSAMLTDLARLDRVLEVRFQTPFGASR